MAQEWYLRKNKERKEEKQKMDIKGKVTEIVDKIKNDKDLKQKFDENPTQAVEGIIGVDLPDDMINNVVAGVKAKLTGDALSDGVEKLKNLF